MKFETLDRKMRVFEQNMDQKVLPELYIIARLDGRGFTRLTKELLSLERPFDEGFRDAMIETVKHLMTCGFKIAYGYTESDEISLLFDKGENGFDRKTRKLISILAGEASAKFTQAMGALGVFDCRLIPIPNEDLVIDYFRWRSEDANRNALNAYCYWKLRDKGFTVAEATNALTGKSIAEKNELLFQSGINYNDLPQWQKRGVGFYYEQVSRSASNQRNGEAVTVNRKFLKTDTELPMNESYDRFLRGKLFTLKEIET
jgi:tRNA(His) guanylyltransferase